jgi:aminomethyltransferase
LHGHELGPGITPLQAGLGWVVGWDKEFVGKAALVAERETGPARVLRGMVIEGRQPARDGTIVSNATGEPIGVVTSGNFSPMLESAIALGFLEPNAEIGDPVTFDVRGRTLTGNIVKTPFVEKKL